MVNEMSLPQRLARIRARASESSLVWTERTAIEMFQKPRAVARISSFDALRQARLKVAPNDQRIIFVDFCPGGVVFNRLDIGWILQSICTLDRFASDEQWEMFESIREGDLLVMKRSQPSSRTMRLHAHGRVVGVDFSDKGDRVFLVNWSHEQDHTIGYSDRPT